ncbi:MAG: metal-dependent hydrolase [Candidatus Lightella neohaematopini]|nr:metal-dependent hydrolase [Candidatus Lightella neohaematopini]MCV2528888.1 metal-dependent hydrolase [Candidatus Lightella neohaematopini]
MTTEGHIYFAVASIILIKKVKLIQLITSGDWWHIILGSLLTCLLPDIDHPKSFIGRRFKWLSIPIYKLFGHRRFTHSILLIIIIAIYINIKRINFPIDVIYAMIIGYISHIIADMLTPAGVPLLWPYTKKFSIPIIKKSNIRLERLISIVIIIYAMQY